MLSPVTGSTCCLELSFKARTCDAALILCPMEDAQQIYVWPEPHQGADTLQRYSWFQWEMMSPQSHIWWKLRVKLTKCDCHVHRWGGSVPRRRWQRRGVPGDGGRTAALYGCLRSDPHWTAGVTWSQPSTDACLTSLEEKEKREGGKSERSSQENRNGPVAIPSILCDRRKHRCDCSVHVTLEQKRLDLI